GASKALTEDIANLRRLLAWAASLEGVDARRLGVLGVSRGAIVAAVAAELEPGLSTVLVLGGADLRGLFRSSKMGAMKRMRRSETDLAGGDLEKAAEKAEAALHNVDPATREGRLDPTRTLLINARWDHVIPREQALALRRAAGGATQYWLPTGHTSSILYARRDRRPAREQFRKTLLPGR